MTEILKAEILIEYDKEKADAFNITLYDGEAKGDPVKGDGNLLMTELARDLIRDLLSEIANLNGEIVVTCKARFGNETIEPRPR